MSRIRAVLTVSFLLNAAALFLPFVDVKEALSRTDTYNLLRSVELLWEAELYILSGIVVAFSVVFPFAKLVVLFRLTFREEHGAAEHWWVARVEALGKWSMIDVFIVCFILALTDGQSFVGATPRPGLYAFIAAIGLSMWSGFLLGRRWGLDPADSHTSVPNVVRLPVLTLASLAWVGFLFVPFLQIDDWLLKDTAFTLITFLTALFSQGAPVVAVVLGGGLIAAPAFELAASWAEWVKDRRGGRRPRWVHARPHVRTVSMLNVFFVALLIFLLEGEAIMSVVPRTGLVLLAVLLVIDLAHFLVARRTAKKESRVSAGSILGSVLPVSGDDAGD